MHLPSVRWLHTLPAAGLLALTAATSSLQAATFVVDRTAAGGSVCSVSPNDCSFTSAMQLANATPAADSIVFAIPATDPGCAAATGVCRIDVGPSSNFPAITSELTIDGYTQPGAAPNTIPAPGANNAQLKIELTSATPAPSSVLWFNPSNTQLHLRGLAIFLPGATGMVGGFQAARIDLRGNWFGVTAAGTTPDYSTSSGAIEFSGLGIGAVIGGSAPADRNVIAGSGRNGSGQLQGTGNSVRVSSTAGGQGVLLFQGNLVGLAPDGITPLPFRDPLTISASDDVFVTPDIRILDNRFVRTALTAGGNFGNALQFSVPRVMDRTALIQGNVFGLGVDGSPIGVEQDAISISVGNGSRLPRIRIGGLLTHEGNTFSSSFDLPGGGRGNAISWGFTPSDSRVEVVGNRMLGSEALGFDLPGPLNARTVNDPGDPDTGANGLQNFPEISAYALNGNQVELTYRVDSGTANSVYPLRVDFYRAAGDEGAVLIGSDTYEAGSAQSDKSVVFTPGLPLTPEDVVIGMATDAEGRSSEFGFYRIQSLAILSDGPDPAPAGVPYTVAVRAEAAAGQPFAPNGDVQISDGRGASCRARLSPGAIAGRSEGSCEMLTTGGAGTVTLTAALSATESAFALGNGASVANATASHTVGAGVTTLVAVSGDQQAAPLGSAFAVPLAVRALGAGGAPIAGVRVDFAGPGTGPGAALSPPSAISGADGIASTQASAIRAGGSYVVAARVGALVQNFSLSNQPGLSTALAIVSNQPNPSLPGQAVSVAIDLGAQAGGPPPTGVIAVSANTGDACTIPLPASTCALEFASIGEHVIQAYYPGDASYTSSKAAFALHTVQPPPTLRIDDVSASEGDTGTTSFVFTVSLDDATGGPVSVDYATVDASAGAPGDYVAASGTLNFSGTQRSQSLAVAVVGDTAVEPDEQFLVQLANASGAGIARPQGVASVLNDDAPPPLVVSIGDATVQEPVSSGLTEVLARFSVSLDRPATTPASVRVRTLAASADSPADFDSNDVVLEFAPGERVQTVDVWVRDDEVAEGSETFALQLSEPQGLVIGDGDGVGTILDGGLTAILLVTSAGDPGDGSCTPGECTLREAIALGNTLELVRIGFDIPGPIPHVIRPLTPLPVPGRPIHTIDGYTQPGSHRGGPVGDGAALDNLIGIELDGGALGVGSTGLNLIYGASVRGLAIHSWRGAGLRLTTRADGRPMVIAGNYIGTDASGQLARPNGVGIEVLPDALVQGASLSWQIGNQTSGLFGASLRADNCNLVSGNLASGIRVIGGVATDTTAGLLMCNRIGLARDGTPLGNAGHGLEILAPTSGRTHGLAALYNIIGSNALDGIAIRSLQPGPAGGGRIALHFNQIGTAAGEPRHNGGHAVSIGSESLGVQAVDLGACSIDHAHGTAVRILGAETRASVWASLPAAGVPIDLGPAGATANDAGDVDSGPNELLNAPELLSAEFNDAGNRMRVRYQLDTQGLRPRVVRFFAQVDGRLESLGEHRYPGGVASVELPATRGFERLAEGTAIVAQALVPTQLIASEISATPVALSSRQALATVAPVREGSAAQARFTIGLAAAVTGNTALSYRTVDGSAAAGSDYQATSGDLVLTPASPQASVDVPILNDALVEADESFTLEVWSATSFGVGSAQAAATIVDEDRLRQDRGQYDALDLDSLNGIEGFRIEHPRSGDAALIDLGDFNGSGGSDLALGLATSPGLGGNPASLHLLPDLVVPANGVVVLPPEGSAQFPRIVDDLQRGSALAPVALAGFRGAGQLPTLGLRGATRTLLLHGRAAPFAPSSSLSALLAPPLAETLSGESRRVLDIGDFNGDGRRDMAILPGDGVSFAGPFAYVLFGTASGVPASQAQLNGSNGFRLLVDGNEQIFGVVPAGDLTGDGRSDLVVRIGFRGAGRNYLVPGRNGPALAVNREQAMFDPFAGAFAWMTGSAGDLDGDGQRDLVLTASDPAGQVRTFVLFNSSNGVGILSGARRSEVRQAFPGDRASDGIAILDLDGNGIEDLALGMAGSDLPNTAAGQVAVLCGRGNWPGVVDLAAPPAQMVKTLGSRQGARMGWRLAPVSDLNGDGRAELAVTAPQAGRSYVLYSNDGIFNGGSEAPPGAPSARSVYRSRDESNEIRFAQQVELIPAGDVDGDGRMDLLAGVPDPVVLCPRNCGSLPAVGALALLPGSVVHAQSAPIDLQRPPTGSTRWRRSEQPEVPLTGFYAPAGDFTGDGRADLAFLAVDGAALGVVAGRAALPAFVDPLAEAQRRGRRYLLDAADGLRVASLGDIDADGFGDLAVLRGAPATRRIELIYGTAGGSPRRSVLVAPAALQPISLARTPGLGRIRGPANPDSFEVILGDGRRAIVFGAASLPASLDLGALGGQGMYLSVAHGLTGETASLAALGDVDADGVADLGVAHVPPAKDGVAESRVEILRGRSNWPASIDLSTTNPGLIAGRLLLRGEGVGAIAGLSALRDRNGDGRRELLISLEGAEGHASGSGKAFIVHAPVLPGGAQTSVLVNDEVAPGQGLTLRYGRFAGGIWALLRVLGDIDGDGVDEIVYGSDPGDQDQSIGRGGSAGVIRGASLP